ncbi:MAG: hypothetical protein KBT06_03455 [Prevotellaceae bacterium]|nr:hypothetical protein [Candidatus Colivivens equi]
MASRIDLQNLLEDILGSKNVYFQPPESLRMVFPCIRYEYADLDTKYADNKPYTHEIAYRITYIDKNPDSTTWLKIADLPKCKFGKPYKADGMYHWVFSIYY